MVGRFPHLADRRGHEMRQALPTELGWPGERAPTAFGKQAIGLCKSLGHTHGTLGKLGAAAVTAGIERGNHFAGKFRGFFENCRHHVGRSLFAARQGSHGLKAGQFFENKLHVA